MSYKENFKEIVPSIVLVWSSTDIKPGFVSPIYGQEELENECK